MEQLYPQNILERHYPVLRERREREERQREDEEIRPTAGELDFAALHPAVLHENEPLRGGSVGRTLNTIA